MSHPLVWPVLFGLVLSTVVLCSDCYENRQRHPQEICLKRLIFLEIGFETVIKEVHKFVSLFPIFIARIGFNLLQVVRLWCCRVGPSYVGITLVKSVTYWRAWIKFLPYYLQFALICMGSWYYKFPQKCSELLWFPWKSNIGARYSLSPVVTIYPLALSTRLVRFMLTLYRRRADRFI